MMSSKGRKGGKVKVSRTATGVRDSKSKLVKGTKYSSSYTYSTEFRCRIYEINPFDLSCMYKIMFEKCAVNNLVDTSTNEQTNTTKEKDELTTLLSASSSHVQKLAIPLWDLISQPAVHEKWFEGWNTRPPLSTTTVLDYTKSCLACRRDPERRSRSLPSRMGSSICVKDDTSRNAKPTSAKPPERPISYSASVSSSYQQPQNRITYMFKHYNDIHAYINQYRWEYTYKRMKQLRQNQTDYPIHYSVTTGYCSPNRLYGCREAFTSPRVTSAASTPSLTGRTGSPSSPLMPCTSPPSRPMTSTQNRQYYTPSTSNSSPHSDISAAIESVSMELESSPVTTSPPPRTSCRGNREFRPSPRRLCAKLRMRSSDPGTVNMPGGRIN